MSEVKIVKRNNPSIVVSSTDPYRIPGQKTAPEHKRETVPLTKTYNNASAGVRIVGAPAEHDMRAAGPRSVGKGATAVTPSPMKSTATRGAVRQAKAENAELTAERDRLERELAAKGAGNQGGIELKPTPEGNPHGSDGSHPRLPPIPPRGDGDTK